MKSLNSVLLSLFLMMLLTACANQQVQQETRYPKIPSVYIQHCEKDYQSNPTIGGVIQEQNRVIGCYESKQDAIRVWQDKLQKQ